MNHKMNLSLGKHSVVDSDVDGLLKWANELPEDVSQLGDASF